MKLQEFYKTPRILLILVLSLVLFGCDKSKIYMKYHFFTRSEVEDIFINTDSVMHFQEEVSKCETYDVFKQKQRIYSESDSVEFLSETGDTIKARRVSSIEISDKSDELAISPETHSSIGTALFSIKDNNLFTHVSFGKSKALINNRDSLSGGIGFGLLNQISLFANIDTNNGDNYIILRADYVHNNINLPNCLFVKFLDNNSLNIQIIYSNKYGFLQIKNTQHEINRIL